MTEGMVAGNAVWTNSEVGLGGTGEAVPWLIIGTSNGISGGQTFATLGTAALKAHSAPGCVGGSLTVIMTEFQVAEKTSVSLLP